ncbi:hypothetical protein ACFVYG_32410 [Streptomyces sp. NPDC058256]|uniref:hypothetical protein n=1 Tax=Streptomyces sp. NPDC058256 TaxID=3346408 RepID=UPI0036E54055
MANRDPYIPAREAPHPRVVPVECRDCPRTFIEKAEPDWPGLCPICSDEADKELTGRSY